MVKQGLNISIIPHETMPLRYHVTVYSEAWDGETCFGARKVLRSIFDALPNDVPPGDFPEWIDAMLGMVVANVRRRLMTEDVVSASAAYATNEQASETLSQDM